MARLRVPDEVAAGVDPYAVLGVTRGASEAEIHTAYRRAVRRTHPDAGGSTAEFEAVQEAYEVLRDPARRRARDATASPSPASSARSATQSDGRGTAAAAMEDLLAESRRLEDEARRLAGLTPRHGGDDPRAPAPGESEDSIAAVLRDAGEQLRSVADEGVRELRRRLRRAL